MITSVEGQNIEFDSDDDLNAPMSMTFLPIASKPQGKRRVPEMLRTKRNG